MKVLVCDPIHKAGIENLKEFAEVELATDLDHEALIEKIPGYEAIVVRSGTEVTKDLIDAADSLKLIVRAGVGLDNIDVFYARKKGIEVENTPEASTAAVSELTFALMLSWARKVPQADKSMREGKWIKSELEGTELRNKTLGIVGVGRIGLDVARKAKCFGMELLGEDPVKRKEFKELGGKYVDLETLLEKSDYVTLHPPLTDKTEHVIGEEEFGLMKDSAVLINTARGGVVDEDALIEALKKDEIEAACLDVYENNPVNNGRFLDFPNVVLVPHLGASTREAQEEVGILAAKKIRKKLT